MVNRYQKGKHHDAGSTLRQFRHPKGPVAMWTISQIGQDPNLVSIACLNGSGENLVIFCRRLHDSRLANELGGLPLAYTSLASPFAGAA